MLSCRVQSAISQGFDCFFDYKWLELDHFIAHAFERTPPTHKMAVRPMIIFALTRKARNMHNRVLVTDNLIKSSVLSHQKQVLSLKLLVSE